MVLQVSALIIVLLLPLMYIAADLDVLCAERQNTIFEMGNKARD